MEKPSYEFHPEKNLKLIEERGISFEDVITILETNGPLSVLDRPNKQKYPWQKIYVLDIDGYAFLVPFEKQDAKIFFKTVYPSSKMTKLFKKQLSRGKHE